MSHPCRNYEQSIIDMVLGVLSTPDQLHIQEHLHACDTCRIFYEGLRRLNKDLKQQLGAERNMSDQIEKVIEKLNQIEGPQDKSKSNRKIYLEPQWRRAAAIFLIFAGLVFNVVYFLYNRADLPTVTVKPGDRGSASEIAAENRRFYAEIKMADQFLAQHNIQALTTLLNTGMPQTKIVVAGHLAQIGDQSVLADLKNYADQWPSDGTDNPYQQAISAIQLRLNPAQPIR